MKRLVKILAAGLVVGGLEVGAIALLARYTEHPFTVVISTHLIEEVASLVEDVVIIHRGQVLKNGPCEELLRQGYTVSGPRSLRVWP